ncbi:hypothetical protein ACFVYP_38370 [Kitasatospora sp. NPDC058201]|uniref:hypothetical protein n=1 Tax=unclassified Kitasatospora TaxID=2633591 RepID=UPI00364D8607
MPAAPVPLAGCPPSPAGATGFPEEFAFEDWLFHMEGLAEDEQKLTDGEHVSGQAADAYRFRVKAVSRDSTGARTSSPRRSAT